MAGNLLAWLVLEGIIGTENLCYKHVVLFIDNTASVSWTQRGGSENSAAEGRLLKALDLRKRVSIASPLVPAHVAGDLNVFGDTPSCSFGYSKQWNCTNDYEFISLINSRISLPNQSYWQGFCLYFVLSTKVIPELGIKAYPMGEWNRLRIIGKSLGGSGVPIANP